MKTRAVSSLLLIVLGLLVAASALGLTKVDSTVRGGVTGTITSGAAEFDFNGLADAAGFSTNFDVAGADHLFSFGYSYRLPAATDETALQTPDSSNFVGDTATMSWTNFDGTGLDATHTLVISEPFTGAGQVVSTMNISNPGGTAQDIDVFVYTDFDIGGTASADSGTLINANDAIQVTDAGLIGLFTSSGSDNFQVDGWPTIRDLIGNGSVDTLANTGLPFGPGDFSGMMQWLTVTIPAGGSQDFTTTLSVGPPPPAPVVNSITPNSGPEPGGTAVTINGSDFASGATVDLGGNACTGVGFVSASELTCTTPAGTGTVDVTVTNPDTQSDTLAAAFTYIQPPTIAAIAPSTGPAAGGTAVSVSGSDFVSGATVTVGGNACAPVVFVSPSQLDCTTPAGTPGSADVSVSNPDLQNDTLVAGFTYDPPLAPVVASVTPSSGPEAGGTLITIGGSNFVAGATVDVGGAACVTVTVVDPNTITCTTPPGTPGPTSVVVTNPDLQSDSLDAAFSYIAAPPPPVPTVSVPALDSWSLLLLTMTLLMAAAWIGRGRL